MTNLPDIRRTEVAGKRVLIRADLNVPMREGRICDATRIERFAPTVQMLTERGAAVVVMTHLGRPRTEPNPHYSARPIAEALAGKLGREVTFVPEAVGSVADRMTGEMQPGDVAVLENVRFQKGETSDDRTFALKLSIHGDIYVNDAFSCAHRAHASTHAIATLLPAFAGPSLIAEVEALESGLAAPRHPVAAIIGGAKVGSKIDALRNLVQRIDYLILGGAVANTFLVAKGHSLGRSLVERDAVSAAGEILEAANAAGCRIILPTDLVTAENFAANARHREVDAACVAETTMALDVGADTLERIREILSGCKTLLWNGPLGAFEIESFGQATFEIARHAADLTRSGLLTSVAGGGDTVAALNAAGVTEQFTHVSTAGGALLEWFEGKTLPGIAALTNNHPNNREVA